MLEKYQPLAYRLRPESLETYYGQKHLVAKGKSIYRMIQSKTVTSMILYGPSGTGKTTLANIIAKSVDFELVQFNAANDTKATLKEIYEKSIKAEKPTILLIDEFHRMDKTKQDFLLSVIENGSIILIGTTTENPYFSINSAIRNRIILKELKSLDEKDIGDVIKQGISRLEDEMNTKHPKLFRIDLTDDAFNYLIDKSTGGIRRILNALELAVNSSFAVLDGKTKVIEVEKEAIIESFGSDDVEYNDIDTHYNLLSALQKSIRGSDVDAALHYTARLLLAGELESVCRRVGITAYEDIGLNNPEAVQRAITSLEFAQKVGMPEAKIPISNAIIELSLSDKSNSAYYSIKKAITDVELGNVGDIPSHLKDTHFSSAKKMGRTGYIYPHDYDGNFIEQQYLPDEIKGKIYFDPNSVKSIDDAKTNELKYKKIHQQILKNLKDADIK